MGNVGGGLAECIHHRHHQPRKGEGYYSAEPEKQQTSSQPFFPHCHIQRYHFLVERKRRKLTVGIEASLSFCSIPRPLFCPRTAEMLH